MAVPKKRRCVETRKESSDSENYSEDENNQENESMVSKKNRRTIEANMQNYQL